MSVKQGVSTAATNVAAARAPVSMTVCTEHYCVHLAQELDKDGSGHISREEMVAALNLTGVNVAEVESILAEVGVWCWAGVQECVCCPACPRGAWCWAGSHRVRR